VKVLWGGDATYGGVTAYADTTISWKLEKLTLALPTDVDVLDPLYGSIDLTRDGAPLAGVAVTATVTATGGATTDLSGTTAADGSLPVHFDTPTLGTYYVNATTPSTSDTLGDTVSTTIEIHVVASTLDDGSETAPQQITVGQTVSLHGSLHRSDGHIAGVSIRIEAHDDDPFGPSRYQTVVTDAAGQWSYDDVPQWAGTTRYEVAVDGDPPRYEPLDPAPFNVEVEPLSSAVTITADKAVYQAGDTATFHIEGDTGGRNVLVQASWSLTGEGLFYGVLPPGGVDVTQKVPGNETIGVAAEGDHTHAGASASLNVSVAASLTSRALHPRRWSGATAVYASTGHPVIRTAIAPTSSNRCLQLEVQRRISAAWVADRTTPCLDYVRPGVTRWTFAHPKRGATYRVRAAYTGDALHIASRGSWIRLRLQREQAS
jgi:hypothetical protein